LPRWLGLNSPGASGVPVSIIQRHPFDLATSYRFEHLTVRIGTGESLQVVVKDFGSSRLPKDDPLARGEREVSVYRDLLAEAEVGTARLYGVGRNPVRLVLEHVAGTDLKHHGLGAWIDSASWLGCFQTRMAGRSAQVRRCQVLIRHDRAFFFDRVRTAQRAVAEFGPMAAHRLAVMLDGYPDLVEVMVDQPSTLVHGSFRPQNIIVSTASDGTVRICPVDWELAGIGSPLYDLAFLADGFRGPKLERLCAAYLRGAGRHPAVTGADMPYVLDCFRLHKIVKSISDSTVLGFRPETIDKLLDQGTELRERLG
jgi:hypothetical protein